MSSTSKYNVHRKSISIHKIIGEKQAAFRKMQYQYVTGRVNGKVEVRARKLADRKSPTRGGRKGSELLKEAASGKNEVSKRPARRNRNVYRRVCMAIVVCICLRQYDNGIIVSL